MLNAMMAVALLLAAPPPAPLVNPAAPALFERYVALEHAFDPAVADLYADTALIKNRRTYPTGQVREATLPATKYKEIIRTAMPVAKARDDRSLYSTVTYTPEGTGVRIKASRYSVLKQYTSPISLLVAPDPKGTWLIVEEITESRP